MKKKTNWKAWLVISASLVIIVSFQNCAGNFSRTQLDNFRIDDNAGSASLRSPAEATTEAKASK